MYIVIGTRPDGREETLEYETLDEAMQKVRDLIEADELDAPVNGPMFVRYAIELDPPLAADDDDDDDDDDDEDEKEDESGNPFIFRPVLRNENGWGR